MSERESKSRYDQDVFLNTFELGAGDALKGLSAQDMAAILTRCSIVKCKNVDKSARTQE